VTSSGPIGLVAPPHDPEVERLRALADSLMTRNLQLEHALESRVVIEQAKGVLAERYDVGVDVAFELLRRAARSNRIRLRALADRVVSDRETPPEILAAVVSAVRR
jgi:AmiR/NasT family two-component response regulator